MHNLILGLAVASAIFNSVNTNANKTNTNEIQNPNTRTENGYLISFI